MPLLAFNLTAAPLALAAGSPVVTLPASASAGARGPAMNVTGELKGLLPVNYAALQVQIDAGSIDLAWTQYPEYPTPGLTALEQPDVESIAMYVDAAGSNTNDGTAASPLATFGEAWDRITATNWRKTARIFVTGSVPLEARGYINSQRAAGKGSGIAVVGSFADQAGTSGAETVGDPTGKTFTDAALLMTPGVFNGAAFVQCLTGANAGARANVESNTATTVVLQSALPFPIGIGDTFVVQLPNSELVQEPGAAIFGYGNAYIGWQGIKITVGGPNILIQVDACPFSTDGLIIDCGGGVFVSRKNALYQGCNNGPWAQDGAASPFNDNSTSGTLFKNAIIVLGHGNVLMGSHMFNGCLGVTGFAAPQLSPDSIICQNTSFILLENGYAKIPAGSIAGSFFGAVPPFVVGGCSAIDFDAFDITGAGPLPALQIQFGSKLIAGAVTGAAGNLGPGITVDQTSQASIDPVLTTLTGSSPGLNDVVVAGTPKGYGALPYLEPNTVGFAG